MRATFPAYLIRLDFITRTIFGEQYKSLRSSLTSFLHSPVTSSLLGPNIPLNTLFSDTLSVRSSLYVSYHVLNPYKTTGKIIVLCMLIFKYLDNKVEDKRFFTKWQQAFPDFILHLISSWREFWFVKFVPKYLNSSTYSKDLISIFILWFLPAYRSRDKAMHVILPALTSSPISPTSAGQH